MTHAAALALAAVFAVAAAAKLARPTATATSFAALGVPAARFAARAVPVVEAALAAALVIASSIGGRVALVVMAAFTLVVVRAIASGVGAPCACFGVSRAQPVSVVDVWRNGLLACLAIVAAVAPAGGARWPALPAALVVVLLVAIARAGLAVLELTRQGIELWPPVPEGER